MQPYLLDGSDVTLAGGHSDGDTPVLLIHGVTANYTGWNIVARNLPGYEVIAPDLRGRGGSIPHDGRAGMAQHADDLVRVLDHFGVEQTPIVGMSMGGFVAMVMAHRHPDRVSRVVLVDGGFPLGAPDFKAAGSVEDVMKPIAARLSVTFPSREAAVELWKQHPSFQGHWSQDIADYAEYDLDPTVNRSRVNLDSVWGDTADLAGGTDLLEAVQGLKHPTKWLVAPRGLLNETPGLYPEAAVDYWHSVLPAMEIIHVPDVNHYTILMTPPGAQAIADAITSG